MKDKKGKMAMLLALAMIMTIVMPAQAAITQPAGTVVAEAVSDISEPDLGTVTITETGGHSASSCSKSAHTLTLGDATISGGTSVTIPVTEQFTVTDAAAEDANETVAVDIVTSLADVSFDKAYVDDVEDTTATWDEENHKLTFTDVTNVASEDTSWVFKIEYHFTMELTLGTLSAEQATTQVDVDGSATKVTVDYTTTGSLAVGRASTVKYKYTPPDTIKEVSSVKIGTTTLTKKTSAEIAASEWYFDSTNNYLYFMFAFTGTAAQDLEIKYKAEYPIKITTTQGTATTGSKVPYYTEYEVKNDKQHLYLENPVVIHTLDDDVTKTTEVAVYQDGATVTTDADTDIDLTAGTVTRDISTTISNVKEYAIKYGKTVNVKIKEMLPAPTLGSVQVIETGLAFMERKYNAAFTVTTPRTYTNVQIVIPSSKLTGWDANAKVDKIVMDSTTILTSGYSVSSTGLVITKTLSTGSHTFSVDYTAKAGYARLWIVLGLVVMVVVIVLAGVYMAYKKK